MISFGSGGFKKIRIGLASPERIRFWSYGEIEKPETINYRTFRPERKGLFCEKIFGPVKDWECACGKYRRVRYRGIVCERCGVEVTHSRVRRERMGHIELATPVSHIWYLKGIPSYLGILMDMTVRSLEDVIYYDSYIVTDVDDSLEDLKIRDLLSEPEYLEAKEKYGNKFKADIGAKAIREILSKMNMAKEVEALRAALPESKGQKRIKITKRLRICESLYKAGNKPEWMVMDVIPVMPPDLRPMVQLEGGRFATSDLNDLYRRVVNRNNRLKRLLDLGAPGMIVRNEMRMLQEAVDVLINNGSRGRSVTGSNGRPLKSLSEIIQGKQGRFRQNLLGKRVDYSGRSVIVVGPHLKLNQCGLPKTMALELFKPFVIRKLVEKDLVQNVKSAKKKIEQKDVVVWDALEEVIEGHPVMLNRAPTLHRLGIQAFEPVLVEGKAIQIPPLVCSAFNADFDGDQMAIHIPLSIEAQAEARLLLLASNNLMSPSNGKSLVAPTQDMVLGLYYLTIDDSTSQKGAGTAFLNNDEAIKAYQMGLIDLQSKIIVRRDGVKIDTTVGRVIFNDTINDIIYKKHGLEKYTFINNVVSKKQIAKLQQNLFRVYGTEITAEIADELKELGFKYSTVAGFSISIDDLEVPAAKKGIIDKANKETEAIENMYRQGGITAREKKQKVVELWRGTNERVTQAMLDSLGELNNVFVMANSGARGSVDQVKQLAGMRGLMADSQGNTVDIPIKSNFKEGLTLTEYFISSYGARKGLVDTALRTADSGYLTRRLVDVAQDVIVTEEDCHSQDGVLVKAIEGAVSLGERIEGRIALDPIVDPKTGEVIVDAGGEIGEQDVYKIDEVGVESVMVRSVLTCKTKKGICKKCYGWDLSSHKMVNLGEAVGIIAAQSIGEPGTQLTMRTFHTGGVDLGKTTKVEYVAKFSGKVTLPKDVSVSHLQDDLGRDIVVSVRDAVISLKSKNEQEDIEVPAGTQLIVESGKSVKEGEVIAVHDGVHEYVVANNEGQVNIIKLEFTEKKDTKGSFICWQTKNDGEIMLIDVNNRFEVDLPDGAKVKVKAGQIIKKAELIATDLKSSVAGRVFDVDKKARKVIINPGDSYPVSSGSDVFVEEGQIVNVDDILAKEAIDDSGKSASDIVSGLPRVEELFEARKPKKQAILAEIDGVIDTGEKGGLRTIIVTPLEGDGKAKEHKVPVGVKIKVFPGKEVKMGEMLTEGVINPHDMLLTKGVTLAQKYLLDEVQRVYRSQGVGINDKHIEVITRQMTKRIQIDEMGDSHLLPGEKVDLLIFNDICEKLTAAGKEVPSGTRIMLGITKASLNTESFISAASFQETARVLTQAAVKGQTDDMNALKENVIIGKLIPAGTGYPTFTNLDISMKDN